MKYLFMIIGFFVFFSADAQTSGIVYYLKNSGTLVSSKDSADYSIVVLSPDTSVDKSLFIVYEYDKTGKRRLVTNSKTNDVNLRYQGHFISYYNNGKKKATGTFEDGEVVGREVGYYPNGNLYYVKTRKADGKIFYSECRDSTGNSTVVNGSGKWVQFDDGFKNVITEGKVDSGKEQGIWHSRKDDTTIIESEYSKGNLIHSEYAYKSGMKTFIKVDVVPTFAGGMEGFGAFLSHNLRYPADARERNIQGKVIISFIVEHDGLLTNFKVARGVYKSIDNEALRVMKLSPKWSPGLANGKAVRVAYSIPLSFTLAE